MLYTITVEKASNTTNSYAPRGQKKKQEKALIRTMLEKLQQKSERKNYRRDN